MKIMPDDRRRIRKALAGGTLTVPTLRALSHGMSAPQKREAAAQEAEVLDLVERMTNWQRSKYTKAGAPKDLAAVRRFATMQRG